MVHGIRFRDGRATYRNRWVRTDAFVRRGRGGRAPVDRRHGEPQSANPPDIACLKDSANTDVVFFNGHVLALWYLCGRARTRLDPATLDTLGRRLQRHPPCLSAHAKVDERTGELMFFDYGPRRPYLRHGVVGARRRRDAPRRHRPARAPPAPRHGDHRALLDPHGPPAGERPGGVPAGPAQDRVRPVDCRPASVSSRATVAATRSAGSRPTLATCTTRSTRGRRATRSSSTCAA